MYYSVPGVQHIEFCLDDTMSPTIIANFLLYGMQSIAHVISIPEIQNRIAVIVKRNFHRLIGYITTVQSHLLRGSDYHQGEEQNTAQMLLIPRQNIAKALLIGNDYTKSLVNSKQEARKAMIYLNYGYINAMVADMAINLISGGGILNGVPLLDFPLIYNETNPVEAYEKFNLRSYEEDIVTLSTRNFTTAVVLSPSEKLKLVPNMLIMRITHFASILRGHLQTDYFDHPIAGNEYEKITKVKDMDICAYLSQGVDREIGQRGVISTNKETIDYVNDIRYQRNRNIILANSNSLIIYVLAIKEAILSKGFK